MEWISNNGLDWASCHICNLLELSCITLHDECIVCFSKSPFPFESKWETTVLLLAYLFSKCWDILVKWYFTGATLKIEQTAREHFTYDTTVQKTGQFPRGAVQNILCKYSNVLGHIIEDWLIEKKKKKSSTVPHFQLDPNCRST